VRHSPLAGENLNVTLKRCKMGDKLVLITNRKSYELSIGTKIVDLELRNGRCIALFVVRVQCRKGSSRSLLHLLMNFLCVDVFASYVLNF